MRLALALILALASTASAADYVVKVPDGFTEQPPDVVGPHLTKLRGIRGTKSVDGQLWMSPDNTTQLTAMRWQITLKPPVDQHAIEEFDRGVVKGVAKAATEHVSDERHWEGNRLIAAQVDINGDMTIKQSRIYIIDRDRTVHMFNVVCAGPGESLANCEAAMASASFAVSNWINLPAKAAEREDDLAFRIGQFVGVLLVMAGVAWIVHRLRLKF